MQSTMMSYPLTLVHLLRRAGRCYPKTEIAARMPEIVMQCHECPAGAGVPI